MPNQAGNRPPGTRAQDGNKLSRQCPNYNVGSPRPTRYDDFTQGEMGELLAARLARQGRLVNETPAVKSLNEVPALALNGSAKTPAQCGLYSHGDLFQQGMQALGTAAWRLFKSVANARTHSPGTKAASTTGGQQHASNPDHIIGNYRSATSLSKFEAAAEKNFDIRKSMLLAPGERPEHILIGDADHTDRNVQNEIAQLVDLSFQDGNKKNKLLVEHPELVGPADICYGIAPAVPRKTVSRMTGCIGNDSPKERARLHAKFTPPIIRTIKEAVSFMYSKSPSHIQAGLTRPDDLIPDGTIDHYRMLDRMEDVYRRTSSSLNPVDLADVTVLVSKVQAAVDAFDNETKSPHSLNARESYMSAQRAQHVGPDHLTVEVVGDTHAENMAEAVLGKHKSWVLDSKLQTNEKT